MYDIIIFIMGAIDCKKWAKSRFKAASLLPHALNTQLWNNVSGSNCKSWIYLLHNWDNSKKMSYVSKNSKLGERIVYLHCGIP